MKNNEVVGKYIIVKSLLFDDFMKDDKGKIKLYESLSDAYGICGMHEFPDVLVLKIEYNHVEK